jgi:hypothetical protein
MEWFVQQVKCRYIGHVLALEEEFANIKKLDDEDIESSRDRINVLSYRIEISRQEC